MMPATTRLDAELVHRGLARSRGRAAELVAAGRVAVGGRIARKPSQQVGPTDALEIESHGPEYVSRAAHKLAGALDALTALGGRRPEVTGAHCVDAGASTGGFTQVLLERGAAHVVAVDVGHGQLDPAVRDDPRVTAVEGCNVRDLGPGRLPGLPADLLVADLSFISLTLVLPALLSVTREGADVLVMVKPQFEVGRERLQSGGVVTDPGLRVDAVLAVARAAGDRAAVRAVVPSPLPGESGNREYFLWLTSAGTRPAVVEELAEPARLREAVLGAVVDGRPVLVDLVPEDAR